MIHKFSPGEFVYTTVNPYLRLHEGLDEKIWYSPWAPWDTFKKKGDAYTAAVVWYHRVGIVLQTGRVCDATSGKHLCHAVRILSPDGIGWVASSSLEPPIVVEG